MFETCRLIGETDLPGGVGSEMVAQVGKALLSSIIFSLDQAMGFSVSVAKTGHCIRILMIKYVYQQITGCPYT